MSEPQPEAPRDTGTRMSDLREEIKELNTKLGQVGNQIELHLNAAISNGLFGEDDPVARSFVQRADKLNLKSSALQADNCQRVGQNIPESTLTTLWSYLSRMTGYGTDEKILEREVTIRTETFSQAQVLEKQLKKTTMSVTRYSDINQNFPSDGTRLALLEDGSAVKLLQDMNEMTPPDEVKAVHMKHTFANTIGPIDKDILQSAFESIEKEIKFILSVRLVKRDENLRGILEEMSGLGRIFVIMLNRYHEGQAGREFAEFATDRFKATYGLVRIISSLLQQILKLQKPIGDILTKVDLSPLPHILIHQNPVLFARKFEEQKRFCQELHRQKTLRSSCEKIRSLVRQCQDFIEGTEALMKTALSIPARAISDVGDVSTPPPTEHSRDSRTSDRESDAELLRLYSRLGRLFKDDEDPDYDPNSHVFVSQGNSTVVTNLTTDDVVATLKDLKLYELKETNDVSEFHAEGSYGKIYAVPFKQANLLVANKRFRVNPDEHKTCKRIIREAKIMTGLAHKNILRVSAFADVPSRQLRLLNVSLISPFYPNGSLDEYLGKHRPVSELVKTKILRDVACGLEYLHDPKKKCGIVLHGDLRAMNVLIGPDQRPLLCDFGMAVMSSIGKDCGTASIETNNAWLAYEFFDEDQEGEKKKIALTIKTDVYAFGCVYYEVLHEVVPYHDCVSNRIPIRKYQKKAPIVNVPEDYLLERGHRQLMDRCWHVEPPRRPSASQLVEYLDAFVSFLSTRPS